MSRTGRCRQAVRSPGGREFVDLPRSLVFLVLFILELWFQDAAEDGPFGNLTRAIRSAVEQATQQADLPFDPEPPPGSDLRIPTDARSAPAFAAALTQWLAPWGPAWTGDVKDFDGLRSWDQVIRSVVSRIPFAPKA